MSRDRGIHSVAYGAKIKAKIEKKVDEMEQRNVVKALYKNKRIRHY